MADEAPVGILRSAVALLVVLASAGDAMAKPYTTADLKILVGKKSYREAFQHLTDVGPADRNADWVDVAAAASAGVLEGLPTDDGSTLDLIDEIDRDFPELLKAARYAKVREDLGYKGLEGCFLQSGHYWHASAADQCLRLATRFVDNTAVNAALALRVAKLARKETPTGSLSLFKRALVGNPAACKDEDLALAVVAGLNTSPETASATDARAMMGTCWDALREAVVKAFDADSKGGYVHLNACEQLKAKKLLSSLQEKQCKK